MVFRIAIFAVAALAGISFAAPSQAETPRAAVQKQDLDLSAQQRRVRPRVRVYRDLQPPFWEYPRPGMYSSPGPGAKRDCRAWYVIEHRPSGSVMTPRMRCEWVRG